VLLCGCSIFMLCVTLIAVHRPLLTVMSLSGESLEIGTGLLMIYSVAAVIRMCNWTQNDTYRSAGDAAYGTILEISFMYAVVLPCVCLTGLVWKAPFLLVFACCYIDEPIRFVLMQVHMYSGKWVRPVTELGRAALPAFRKKHVRDKAQRTKLGKRKSGSHGGVPPIAAHLRETTRAPQVFLFSNLFVRIICGRYLFYQCCFLSKTQ